MAILNFYLEKRQDKLPGAIITQNVPIFMGFNFDGKRLQWKEGRHLK